MKITENVGYLNRLFLYGMFCTLFSLVGTSCSTTKNLIDANDIDYIKFINGRPWLILYAWVYRIIYNFKHKKEFMLNAVNSLDDEKTYILAQKELEMFKEIGLE